MGTSIKQIDNLIQEAIDRVDDIVVQRSLSDIRKEFRNIAAYITEKAYILGLQDRKK